MKKIGYLLVMAALTGINFATSRSHMQSVMAGSRCDSAPTSCTGCNCTLSVSSGSCSCYNGDNSCSSSCTGKDPIRCSC
jgi:hypothetical protein